MLQIADTVSRSSFDDGDAARSFLQRIDRIAFIATPHSGSDAATWLDRLRILLRPSIAATCLVRNDGSLRALNEWYRAWASDRSIAHMVLAESKPTYSILIVPPDSANPGLQISPIILDEDHLSICKPADRSADTYIHIKRFLSPLLSPFEPIAPNSRSANAGIGEEIFGVLEKQESRISQIVTEHIQNTFDRKLPDARRPTELVDREIKDKQHRLKQLRFIEQNEANSLACAFGDELTSGPLSLGTDAVRCVALAWCARVLFKSSQTDSASTFLSLARRLGDSDEIKVTEALLLANTGDVKAALRLLSPLDTPFFRTAALISQSKSTTEEFLIWLKKAKIDVKEIDADGKVVYLQRLVANKSWEEALAYVQAIEESDLLNAPVLQLVAAHVYLSSAVPIEFRDQQFQHFPINARNYPLSSTENALAWRRSASKLFDRCEIEFGSISKRLSKSCSDFSLWLNLRDPEYGESARGILEASLAEPENVLGRSLLAIQFGLNIDTAVLESEINRQEALGIATNSDLASAYMACLSLQSTPEGSLSVLIKHKEVLISYFSKFEIVRMELSLNLKLGNHSQAENLFQDLVSGGISDEEKARIANEIAQRDENVSIYIEQFKTTGAITELAHLVNILEERHEWQEVCKYGRELFNRTGAMQDAERLAVALNALNRFSDLKEFLLSSGVNRTHSNVLRSCWCAVLYRDGEFEKARREIVALKDDQVILNHTDQLAAIAVSSGRWGDLVQIANLEWEEREHRDTRQLLSAARLSFISGGLHGMNLLRLAVTRAGSNPNVLADAYFSAVSAGLEDSEEVGEWLSAALKLSGDSGPFKSMSVEELKKIKPVWDRQSNSVWRQLSNGELPIFTAAEALNHSLIDLTLAPHIANKQRQDVRHRHLIPSFSGERTVEDVSGVNNIAIDASSLLTMGVLDLLTKLSESVTNIFIPHTTLSWLFTERQKVTYHQPTKVKHASQLRDMLAVGKLKTFSPKGEAPLHFARDVGEDLAVFLLTASEDVAQFGKKSYVVRSSPIQRLGTLQQNVDVSQYENVLISCSSLVEILRQEGHLTSREDDRATAYLKNHEQVWPNEPKIEVGATLYIDDLSVTYLRHIGVLDKLKNVFGDIYISRHVVDETNALLDFANRSAEILKIIESIRAFLEQGIETRKVLVSPLPENEVEGDDIARPFSSHPTMALMNSVIGIDAIVADDRFLNRLRNAQDKLGNTTRLLTTLDLIEMLKDRGNLSEADARELNIELRRGGHFGVNVSTEEICDHLGRTGIRDGAIIESAELKIIREYYLLVRMRSYLQLPGELPWYQSFLQNFIAAIRIQWTITNSAEIAAARSNWLFAQIDPRLWVQFISFANDPDTVSQAMAMQVMLLISICWQIPTPQREKFNVWLEENVLANHENMMPGFGERLHELLKKHFAALIHKP